MGGSAEHLGLGTLSIAEVGRWRLRKREWAMGRGPGRLEASAAAAACPDTTIAGRKQMAGRKQRRDRRAVGVGARVCLEIE